MAKLLFLSCLVALAGCSGVPQGSTSNPPCSANPGSYACQVDTYNRLP